MSLVNEMLNELQKNQQNPVGFDQFVTPQKKSLVAQPILLFFIIIGSIVVLLGFYFFEKSGPLTIQTRPNEDTVGQLPVTDLTIKASGKNNSGDKPVEKSSKNSRRFT